MSQPNIAAAGLSLWRGSGKIGCFKVDKVRMNAIVPGFFITNQNRALLTNEDGSLTARGNAILSKTPFKRFGAPEELIGALIYLLSDASKFVNGENITVDGGFGAFSGV